MPRVVSVNVGQPRQISVRRGRPFMSSIVKDPVEGRVRATGVNLEGDRQADLTVHGGADKAVYAYAIEDIAWGARARAPSSARARSARTSPPRASTSPARSSASAGASARRSSRSASRGCRAPSSASASATGGWSRRFAHASRPGAYLRIVGEGDVGAGDPIELLHRPEHGVTVQLVSDAFLVDPSLQPQAAKAPELAASLADELRAVA